VTLKRCPIALLLLIVNVGNCARDCISHRRCGSGIETKKVSSAVGFLLGGVLEDRLIKQVRRQGNVAVVLHAEAIDALGAVPGIKQLLINIPFSTLLSIYFRPVPSG